jgi:hypothetical protein
MECGVGVNAAALRDDDPSFEGADWKMKSFVRGIIREDP